MEGERLLLEMMQMNYQKLGGGADLLCLRYRVFAGEPSVGGDRVAESRAFITAAVWRRSGG